MVVLAIERKVFTSDLTSVFMEHEPAFGKVPSRNQVEGGTKAHELSHYFGFFSLNDSVSF